MSALSLSGKCKPEFVDVSEDLAARLAGPAVVALLVVDVDPVGLVSVLLDPLGGSLGPEGIYTEIDCIWT